MAHVNSAKFLITPFLKNPLDGYFCINTFRLFKNDLFSRHNLKTANKSELNILKPEVYFQPSQTSTMELFLRSSGGVLKVFLWILQNSQENTCAWDLKSLSLSNKKNKKNSDTVVFLWILRNFFNTIFKEPKKLSISDEKRHCRCSTSF